MSDIVRIGSEMGITHVVEKGHGGESGLVDDQLSCLKVADGDLDEGQDRDPDDSEPCESSITS